MEENQTVEQHAATTTANERTCLIEGYLKFQYMDSDGLYQYKRQLCRVSLETSTLECMDEPNSTSTDIHDLRTAYSAKRLPSSTSSSIGGYAFSIVWCSGSIWLFLADDANSCDNWVSALNQAIKGQNAVDDVNPKRLSSDTIETATISRLHNTYSDMKSHVPTATLPSSQDRVFSSDIDVSVDTAQVSLNPMKDYAEMTSPESEHDFRIPDSANTTKYHANARLSITNVMPGFSRGGDDYQGISQTPAVLARDILSKQHTQSLTSNLSPLRQSYASIGSASEPKHFRSPSRYETEPATSEVLRIENEPYKFQQAAINAVREQHSTEMAVLQGDFDAQRKRLNDAFVKEKRAREQAERQELSLREQLATSERQYKDKCRECENLTRQYSQQATFWENERTTLQTELNALARRLQEEISKSATRARTEMTSELAATTQEYEARIAQCRNQTAKATRAECEKERARYGLELSDRYRKELDAALARAEEQRIHEVDAIKKKFLTREQETADDVQKLQELHEKRVGELERAVTQHKIQLEQAHSHILQLTAENHQTIEQVRKDLEHSASHAQTTNLKVGEIQSQLDQAIFQKQEADTREVVMRERLAQVLDERRIERAETLELRRQISELTAECDRYQYIAGRADHQLSTHQAEAQITQEELAMLEHENARLKRECDSLSKELSRADKFLYGTKKSSSQNIKVKANGRKR